MRRVSLSPQPCRRRSQSKRLPAQFVRRDENDVQANSQDDKLDSIRIVGLIDCFENRLAPQLFCRGKRLGHIPPLSYENVLSGCYTLSVHQFPSANIPGHGRF